MVRIGRSLSFIAVFILLSITLIVSVPEEADGQEYDFSTVKEKVFIKVLKDGRAVITYNLVFMNYGSGFNVVDIGLPNFKYDKDSASAFVRIKDTSGRTVSTDSNPSIRMSWYVYPGLEVHVNGGANRRIELDFTVTCDWMVWESPNNKKLASIEFRPTWFSQDYQRGSADSISVDVNLPLPIEELDRIVWEHGKYDRVEENEYGVILGWDFGSMYPADMEDGKADVGVAFPKQYVDNYYKKNLWVSIQFFFQDMFGTFWMNKFICCFLIILLVVVAIIVLVIVSSARSKKNYFRPSISVPGAGPRLGLTAPEAAIVLELPLDRVVEMVFYGMLKKGSIKIVAVSKPPLIKKLDVNVLTMSYEKDFFETISYDGAISESDLKRSLEKMIKATEIKLKGFSQRRTEAYYKGIVRKAWDEVKVCGNAAEVDNVLRFNDEWLPLDRNYDGKMSSHVHIWYLGRPEGGDRGFVNPGGYARAFSENLTSISGNMVSSTTKLTHDVVNTLHPPPPPSTGGSSYHGGSFHSCACACACACAGGGR